VGAHFADHVLRDVDGHAHDDHVRCLRRVDVGEPIAGIGGDDRVTQVAEEAREHLAHAALAAEDRHRARRHVEGHLGLERRLVIAARHEKKSVNGLDGLGRQPQLLGAVGAIAEQAPLAVHVPDANPPGAFMRGHLGHDGHAPREELEHLAVDGVDHGAERREGPGRNRLVGHGRANLPRFVRVGTHDGGDGREALAVHGHPEAVVNAAE
jgi:hypothetical protein